MAEGETTQINPQDLAKVTKIKKLVMDGFKSFGKYTELLFGDDFNVILGPNGSGKSNVLDALCFVLGKSSSKQLRAEKSANLIYNGGKTKQPGKAAEVSIVFDNSKKTFPLSEPEIKVSRIVRKDGGSKYKINNKTTTRGEIIELLNSAKINPDGYNIILQGDIVRLVEMSPAERRGIIEEIAGIGIYEEKKQQALGELSKVEDRLNEAEIILKERESYLKDLKKDRDQAIKYKELSDKIKQNKASYLRLQLDRKQGDLKKSEEKSAKNKDKLAKLQETIKKNREDIAKHKETIASINKEIEQKGEVEQIKLQKELEQLRVDIATHKQRVSTCQTEIERITQRREQLSKNYKEVDAKTKELTEQKKNTHAQIETLQKTIKELDDKIKAFKDKHNLADEADIDQQFEKFDKQAEDKQREIQTLREKQQELLREKDKAEYQLSTLDEKIAKVKELQAAHKEEIAQLKKNKDAFKKLTLELNELLNQDSQDANTLARHRQELQRLRENEHKLAIKQSAAKDSANANIATKKVIENGKQVGHIYGTVAELGSSPSKYTLALEIAASQKINSVVAQDDKTASSAIKYLKQQRLGTVTFLPLNKIKPAPARAEIKDLAKKPGVHGLAVDLLEFDPKFKNIFSHVFGNTLVVDSIDIARKIGIGKARMVSLDGDISELSGAMTGGFRHKKAGSFKEKEIDKKLDKAREEIATLESSLSTIETRRRENEDNIAKLRETKAHLEGEIIKQEKSLHLDTGDLEANEQYKKDLHDTIKRIGKDIDSSEEQINNETQNLTQLKIEKQQLRNKIVELRSPRLLAELNAFEEKKKELEQETIRLESELKHTDMQLKEILGRDAENIQKLLKDLTKEESGFKDELKTLNGIVKDKEKELSSKEKEQEQFFSQYKGLFDKRNKITDSINALENTNLGHEEQARKEELTLNTTSIEEARIKAEIAGLTAEFEQFEGIELNMKKPEEQLKKEIKDFERMMSNIGNVNMRALEIYDTVEKEYSTLLDKKKVLLGEKDDVLQLMEEIETNKKDIFLNTLKIVDEEFQRIFTQLTTKGQAYLVLDNKDDPFDGGLRINVKITGNKFLDIRSLSGGEKTMTALAFLFAIQEHEPASFYVLDEVDAALDKHNSEKLAKLIRSYCGKAQYIVISHNDAIISEGDILYGISMNLDAGLSKVLSLKA